MSNPNVSCPYCHDLEAGQDIVFENKTFFVRWDKYPVTEGHLLVIPKRHILSFAEIREAEGRDMLEAIKAAMNVTKQKVFTDAWNVGVNDGVASGQTIEHTHIHVIPRKPGDVEDPRGGIRRVLPDKSDYWTASELAANE